jgi:hypothetical protein
MKETEYIEDHGALDRSEEGMKILFRQRTT